jgi:hypothetical protein
MPNWIIDDKGDLTDAQSPRLRHELGGFSLGGDFVDYVVRNLGFVLIAPLPNGSMRVSFRPRVASPLALAGLVYWLSDRRPRRIVLSHFERDWRHELLGSFSAARHRIIELTANAQAGTTNEFLSKPLNREQMTGDSPLMALLRLHDEGRNLALDTVTDFSLQVLKGRYLVTEIQEHTERLVLTAVGPGLDPQARFWLERFVGTRLEDQADIQYGRWVAETTRDVILSGKPRLDAVDVSVQWPTGNRQRYQFQRALVPMSVGQGRRGLLSATIKDTSIDLRGASRVEVG